MWKTLEYIHLYIDKSIISIIATMKTLWAKVYVTPIEMEPSEHMNLRNNSKFNIEWRLSPNTAIRLYCLFGSLSLIHWSCSLRDHWAYNKASISCWKANRDGSEYVLLLLGYGDQYGIKIYKFKWDLELFSEWRFSNKDCRVFNQKVIHSFNPMLLFLLLALGMF